MNPTFISRMLQSLVESTSGFGTGRRSRRRREEPAFTVFEVPFWSRRRMKMMGEGSHAFRSEGMGWGGGKEIVSVDIRLRKWNSKHLFVSRTLRFSSTKFSFRSPGRMRLRVCVRPRVPTSGVQGRAGHGGAWQPLARLTQLWPLHRPPQRDLERETCLG